MALLSCKISFSMIALSIPTPNLTMPSFSEKPVTMSIGCTPFCVMKVSVAFFPSSMLMTGMHSLVLQFSSMAARQKSGRRTGERLRNEVMDNAMVKISLAGQPTSAQGGKGLVNALYSFCNFGMFELQIVR